MKTFKAILLGLLALALIFTSLVIVGGSSAGTAAVVVGAIGGALGWIIGGTLSRKFINKDLKFSVWVPLVRSKAWTIY